jgi:3-oxoadipate enol-lactonase
MVALLDALGVTEAHVAGLSIGGLIAQSLSHQAPTRVRTLTLCDTAAAIPTEDTWRQRAALVRADGTRAVVESVLARWVTTGFLESPAAHGLRAMLLRTPAEGYAAAAEAIATADLTAATRTLRLPTLVIVGDRDESTPIASARTLCELIPDARLVVLPKAAHIPTVEHPDAVTAAMRAFLMRHVDMPA